MVPCMTLYAILGKRLEKAGIEDDNPYREWVETYSSDEFWEAKEQAEGLLDVLTPHGCEMRGTYTPRPCASSILFCRASRAGLDPPYLSISGEARGEPERSFSARGRRDATL